jgi:carbamoyl-phosphate synthase large subunit
MINVLMPSAGKRYLHIRYIKEARGVGKLVTTEMSPLAPAIHAADACYRAPRILSPDYLDTVLRICIKEKINLVIPLMDLDIVVFSRNRKRFEERGIQLLLHPAATIELSMDKLATYETLHRGGIPAARTVMAADWKQAVDEWGFPIMLKPRHADMKASGEYTIQRVNNLKEMNEIWGSISEKENKYVLQEFLPGTELTVDFFCGQDGKVVSVVPAERLSALSKAFSKDGGAIDQGRTFHDDSIAETIRKMAAHIAFWGAANIQGYRDQEGQVKVIEINPRFTGATVLTKGAGHDYFQWSVNLAAGKEIPIPSEDFRDVCMSSWLSPIFFSETNILNIS